MVFSNAVIGSEYAIYQLQAPHFTVSLTYCVAWTMDPPGPPLDIAYHGTFAYALPCVGCPEPDPEPDAVPAMAFLYLYSISR